MFELNNNYEYNLYLCNVDKSIICSIDYISIDYTENFREYDELSFEVPLYDNGWRQVENKYFNYLQPLYLILMEVLNNDELLNKKYFIVDSPTFSYDNGVTKKSIRCYSSDYEFNNRYLNSYEDVRVLFDSINSYDFDDTTKGGILNYMLDQMENTWSINHISDDLIGVYHSFNFSSSTYRSVIESLEEQYNCYILFDTVNNQINIYSKEEYGESTDIIISDENYLKSLSCDIKNSEMVTKLKVYGKDNITVVKYNPLGQIYILDYDWFYNNGRMSNSLSNAYLTWKTLVSNNETTFQNYLTQLDSLTTSLTTKKNELVTLKTELEVIETNMESEKVNSYSTTSAYSTLKTQYDTKNVQINTKQDEIDNLNTQINNINSNISTLNTLLSITTNFTEEQRKELSKFTIEGKLNLDTVSDELQLYTYAKEYIKIKNKPSIDMDLNLIDLFSISDKFIESKYLKLKVGNYIYLDCSSLGFNYEQYMITRISHRKLDNSLTITISNKDRLNSEIYFLNRIFVASSQAADTLITNESNYGAYTQDQPNILTNDSVIGNDIQHGNLSFTQRGFIGTDLGGSGAIQILNDKIIISPDSSFSTYHTLLSGHGLYLEKDDKLSRIVISPSTGIQIDRNYGTLLSPSWGNQLYIDTSGSAVFGGAVSIGSGNSIFKADTNGIYLGNSNFVLAPFRVTPAGVLYATNANISGTITGSTISGSIFRTNSSGNNLVIGSTDNGWTGFIDFVNDTNIAIGSLYLDGFEDIRFSNDNYIFIEAYKDLQLISHDTIIIGDSSQSKVKIIGSLDLTSSYVTGLNYASINHDHGDSYVKSFTGENIQITATATGINIRRNGVTLGNIAYT